MIPNDYWLIIQGWNDAHEPPEAGSNAPSLDEAQELVRKYG